MKTTRLIVARHGNTFGPGDIVTRVGKTDLPLVESGLTQGKMLGRYLKTQQLLPDLIFTSHLQRTIQTAKQAQAEMGTQLSLQTLSIFNEIDYGPDENQPEEAVVARLGKQALEDWDTYGVVPEGWNVDPKILLQNWKDFALEILHTHAGKTVLVVTSNGIARFSPYLTGNFSAFRKENPIKISTGAMCLFENREGESKLWICKAWNLKPKDH